MTGEANLRLKRVLCSFLSLPLRLLSFRRRRKKTPSTLLIVRQHDQLGDMLCAVPLLGVLRSAYPSARIVLVASPVNASIMERHPFLDEVLLFDKRLFWKSPSHAWRFFKRLRNARADVALVPSTVSMSTTSGLLTVLSGAPVRVGPRSLQGNPNPASSCFNRKVDLDWRKDPCRHQVLRNLDLLPALGLETPAAPPLRDLEITIGLTSEEDHRAEECLRPVTDRHRIIVGLHCGAGKPENRWGAEHFANLANHLADAYDAGIVLTAGPMDADPLQAMSKRLRCEYVLLHNQPIRLVAAVIKRLDCFVTNDTGIMHVAAGTGTRLVSLFGPTSPLQWAPFGDGRRYIASPGKDITAIPEEKVYSVLREMLQSVNGTDAR